MSDRIPTPIPLCRCARLDAPGGFYTMQRLAGQHPSGPHAAAPSRPVPWSGPAVMTAAFPVLDYALPFARAFPRP